MFEQTSQYLKDWNVYHDVPVAISLVHVFLLQNANGVEDITVVLEFYE